MDNNKWFIKSTSLSQSPKSPTKEKMEKLILPLPQGWEVVNDFFASKDGHLTTRLGHINPNPIDIFEGMMATAESGLVQGISVASVDALRDQMEALNPQKFDYIADLTINGYADKQIAKEFFENFLPIPVQGLETQVPGAPMGTSLDDVIENFAPKEMVDEMKSALVNAKRDFAGSGVDLKKGKYLGGGALLQANETGKGIVIAVLVNNFVITGMLLASDALDPGSTPVHSIACERAGKEHSSDCGCKFCRAHKPCSTLKTEGFIHKEAVRDINRLIFSRIRGEEPTGSKDVSIEIIRKSDKIENPEEGFEIENGDTLKTDNKSDATIQDASGNEISISSKSEVKLNGSTDIEILNGTIEVIFENIGALEGGGYSFKCRTPQAVCGVRGTVFSLFTDENFTTLTVVEGEVEFSDLKGNKAIVKTNQFCICSKDHGLQKPVVVPGNLNELFIGR